MAQCVICRNEFDENDVLKLGDQSVCSGCKPALIEKLRDGQPIASTERRFGGFWIRFAAQILDGIILAVINLILGIAVGVLFRNETGIGLTSILSFVIGIAYVTFFLGRYDATPGKMACGLKVIRADGRKITYGRAFGRYWANYLSALILCIGYIIAAFDREKRALHDRICDTRVVRA